MEWQPGDIAACYGAEPVSLLISGATSLPWGPVRYGPSHIAIIARKLDPGMKQGVPLWFESTSLCRQPCLVRGACVAGCQVHYPFERVKDYGGRVVQYRPHPLWRFQLHEAVSLSHTLNDFVRNETAYDTRGALLSRSHVLQHLSCLAGAPLTTLFCSELVAAVLQRFGRLCAQSHPGKFHPAKLLRWLVRMGVYQRVERPPLRLYDPDKGDQHTRGAESARMSTRKPPGTRGAGTPAAG